MDVSFQRKNYTSSIFCSKHLVAAIVLRLSYYIVLQRLFIGFGSVYSLTTYVDKPFVQSDWSNANLKAFLWRFWAVFILFPRKCSESIMCYPPIWELRLMYIWKKKSHLFIKNPKFPFVMGLRSEWIICRAQEVEFLNFPLCGELLEISIICEGIRKGLANF